MNFRAKLGFTASATGGCTGTGQDGTRRPQPGASLMRHPKPFTVIQNGKPLFTVHAYSIEQARAVVAAKIAGETIVVAVSLAPTRALWETFDGAAR
jgi:hypothetical protein